MFSCLCPKLFWSVHDETLYKGLSSNEFLKGRIRKLSPLSFLFFIISFSISYLFFSNVFSLLSFFQMGPWPFGVCGGGEVHLITHGRWVVNVRLIICQNDSIVLNKVSTITVKNNLLGVLLFALHLKMAK